MSRTRFRFGRDAAPPTPSIAARIAGVRAGRPASSVWSSNPEVGRGPVGKPDARRAADDVGLTYAGAACLPDSASASEVERLAGVSAEVTGHGGRFDGAGANGDWDADEQ